MEGKLSRTAQKIPVFIADMVSVLPATAMRTLSAWQLSKSAKSARVLGTEHGNHSSFHLAPDLVWDIGDTGVKEC